MPMPMPNAHAILNLIGTYGYPGLFAAVFVGALGIGIPVPVTVLLLTLGALSGSHGGPSFVPLALAGIAGAVGGHNVDYWCGRLGNRLLNRRLARGRRSGAVSDVIQAMSRLRGGRAIGVFISRFLLTSIASPVSLLAGATRMGFGGYMILEVTGEAIYVVGNLALGRAFGTTLLSSNGALPVFWLVVTVATLLPLVLIRLAMRMARRTGHDASHPLAPVAPPH